jgi:hypothetical protein
MTNRTITITLDITGATDTHCGECKYKDSSYYNCPFDTFIMNIIQEARHARLTLCKKERTDLRHPDCIAAEKRGKGSDMGEIIERKVAELREIAKAHKDGVELFWAGQMAQYVKLISDVPMYSSSYSIILRKIVDEYYEALSKRNPIPTITRCEDCEIGPNKAQRCLAWYHVSRGVESCPLSDKGPIEWDTK